MLPQFKQRRGTFTEGHRMLRGGKQLFTAPGRYVSGRGRSSGQLFRFYHDDAATSGAFVAKTWMDFGAVNAANDEVTLWRTSHAGHLSLIVETYSKS
jgi:hypothetical protein